MAKKISHKIFNSKILLFGEHIINKGAKGLATPVEQYNGMFKFGDLKKDRVVQESNKALELVANYLIYHEQIAAQYDTNQMLEDIENGLYFDSNIPQGYGLGSSGALVAAIYHQYFQFSRKNMSDTDLKNQLAILESYYHGKSSGLDAMVCYLNKTVLLEKGEITKTFHLPAVSRPAMKVFLINTHIPRSTSPYVKLFLEKCKDAKFMTTIERSLIPTTNIAIESFLDKKYEDLTSAIKLISQLQYDLLPEFIPDKFKELWKEGLKNNEYHLKICGAGGGGFIIGFAKANADLDLLLGYNTDVVELMTI
jgi:mevalonate kinase